MNRTTKTASVFAQDQAERVRFGRSKEANDNAGLRENRPVPYGLRLQTGHAALLVAHLERPNFTPRALPGLFAGSNLAARFIPSFPRSFA